MATPLFSGTILQREYSADITVTPLAIIGVNSNGPFKVLSQNEGGGAESWSTIWVSDKDAGKPIQAPSDKIRIGALDDNIKVEVFEGSQAIQNPPGALLGVSGKIVSVSQTFARPSNTTPYTAGDVVSNDATTTVPITFTGALRVLGGSGWLTGARLITNLKSITPRLRVHLFNAAGATLAGDNLPHKSLFADTNKRIASFDLPAMATPADAANSDISSAADLTLRVPVVGVDANLYAVLEVLDVFTPASGQQFTLVLMIDQN